MLLTVGTYTVSTVSSVTVRFRELDEIAYEYLCSFRRSNIVPP
jgi:hypothetical protein